MTCPLVHDIQGYMKFQPPIFHLSSTWTCVNSPKCFLAGGGHIDLWLLDSQLLILLEGLIGGASIDGMS